MGKNRCKSTKMSEIREKMGNPMPFERIMGPNRHNMENYGDLQPVARSMKPTLWVPSENFSFGLLPLKAFVELRHETSHTKSSSHTEFKN